MGKTDIKIDNENLELRMERIFNAPPELLWDAHVDPELIPKWWGRKEDIMEVAKMNPIKEGEWQFETTDSQGNTEVFYGEYLELVKPEYITWTFNYQPVGPGHEAIETVRFKEVEPGKTKLSTVSKFKNKEDFEGMVQSGFEDGAIETWDRLEELLNEMK